MKLNIYNHKKIEKTYEAQSFDLMFGTVEDVAAAVNIDAMQSGSDVEIIKAVGSLVLNSMDTVKDLLKQIFEGITDDEIRRAQVVEIAAVLIDVVKYTISQLNFGGDSKN